MGRRSDDLNFEVNLLPVISLLAVLISFLLLTVAWVSVGSLDFSQALGDSEKSASANVSEQALWTQIENDGRVYLLLKQGPNDKSQKWFIQPNQTGINWLELEPLVAEIAHAHPDVKTALVLPDKKIRHQDIVRIMDHMKRNDIRNIGLSSM